MNDQTILPISRTSLAASAAMAIILAAPANAGETVLYGPAPDWIDAASLDLIDVEDAPSTLIYDWQQRLEDGVVTEYEDAAIRIDNPELLMDHGTVSLSWLPDKGDLTVHRVEIIRGDERIDVIDGGTEFEVIRRERGLEQRLLDGRLTATLAVSGLQVDDILRVTHSVTVDDQALGDEMQASQYLFQEPWQVGFSRAIVSWPENEDVYWRAEDVAGIEPPVVKEGYKTLTVALPIDELPDMPGDAPSRFSRDPVLRVGTFADWQELSRAFAPHYQVAAEVADDSAVAAKAREIRAATSDPLERTALAVRLVQDEVSYLLNGLDGGNYMPQSADETWEKRYGDCKAKSVLLYSLLSQMGIEAIPVLVSTRGGDAIPELLPIPGNFDHMIVRANIDGTDYWLDGTSTATRLSNIGDVPAFFYALPLPVEGADLVPMMQRRKAIPNMAMDGTTDYSAGIDFPSLFSLTMRISGPQGASLRAAADEADEEQLKRFASSFASGPGGALTSVALSYDDEEAVGILEVEGVMPTEFTWTDGRMRLSSDQTERFAFNPDRARPEWRDIPVRTGGPQYTRINATIVLPDGMTDFEATGDAVIDDGFANTVIYGKRSLDGNVIRYDVDVWNDLGEIPASNLPAHKRKVRQLNALKSEILAPEDFAWRWEVDSAMLARRVKPLLEAYDAAVDFAADDDWSPLTQRASFKAQIFDWEGVLTDLDTLIANQPSAYLLGWRGGVHEALGNREAAIADAQAAYDLDPSTYLALNLAELLAYGGQRDEALELLSNLPVSDDEEGSYASTFATVAGLAGRTDDAIAALEEQVADKPTNASVLNADCWFRGLFNVQPEAALSSCTKAIERATNSAPMLDSRAMVSYRMGDYDAALSDLDSALELAPGLSASLYLRGIVRLEKGDKAGRTDVERALRMAPELAAKYAMHGVVPKD
ncbi:DUF3857 domain-containing protein [Erythrobacter aquimaris]|uniref:DUF3857 domain-containing protein n=1 Tax=Qipengyuania aquimaris TaxID=255984 RepID=A0A6I4TLN1_9SPHN|nr:DUF3857 domain-containing protein [Qipengyuania aquimaris]MXO95463.1 DUF3857 domain-containing protein [Qipengyuania aquimaris]